MKASKILVNINEIFLPIDKGHPLRGKEMSEYNIIKNGYIAIKDEYILKVGEGLPPENIIAKNTKIIDASNKVATPGLIDSHTHLVYGGSRENEFVNKIKGATYLEILEKGGGILSTVKSTKKATFDELFNQTNKLVKKMMIHGVTTAEAKSGYGLEWGTEKKQLEVIKKINNTSSIDLIPTFLGAHAIPIEYKKNPDEFVKIIEEMLEKVKEEELAEFCDVFCDDGVFTAEQSYNILKKAKDLGFKLRIHSDEIKDIGGSKVAKDLNATSAEHLMVLTDEGINNLKEGNVIANILPATTFSLMQGYASARKMIEKGLAITLGTDSNPGSCPTANMQFVMQLGCFALKLTPEEVFNAVTINAAYSVDRAKTVGSFDVGKKADIVLYDAPTLEYLLYFFATNLVTDVYKNGEITVKDRRVI